MPTEQEWQQKIEDRLLLNFALDRVTAHNVLFKHRHTSVPPPAHREVIDLFYSDVPRLLIMGFRSFAKSTLAEECVTVSAIYKERRNIILLGENEARAVERLKSVRHELEYNDDIVSIFGPQVGPEWGDTRLVTAGGVCIQAYGRNQSLRGAKYLQWRPDLVVLDDIEDDQSVSSREARLAVIRWWTSVVRPLLADNGVVRVLATPMADGRDLDDKSFPLRLEASKEWTTLRYPIKYRDPITGAWVPTWPSRFTLAGIDRIEQEYREIGRLTDFQREYMLEAVSDEERTFPSSIIPAFSPARSYGWRSPTAVVDPARTSRKSSDYTGWAVWSWEGSKLVVWESGAKHLTPSEIIDLCFDLGKRYTLAVLGVETDGLDEFILQPLRSAMLTRNQTLPVVPIRAPRGKVDFIRQLQPFFVAGQVEFVGEHTQLRDQLLAFPTGRDDAPNALAYALQLRGVPRYPDFAGHHVRAEPYVDGHDYWLAVSSEGTYLAAVLVATKAPSVVVLRDWVVEGDPLQLLPRVFADAKLELQGEPPRICAPARFHEHHDVTNLRAAARRIPARLRRSGDGDQGREVITQKLREDWHTRPHFVVSERARWTLRAMTGGTSAVEARSIWKPLDLLTEALESLIGGVHVSNTDFDDDRSRRYDWTGTGRKYLTSSPLAREPSLLGGKSSWQK